VLLETRQPHSFNVIKNASTVNHVESVSVTGTTLHLKKMSKVWLAIALTHIHLLLQFLVRH